MIELLIFIGPVAIMNRSGLKYYLKIYMFIKTIL
jgi:hypothetical protein